MVRPAGSRQWERGPGDAPGLAEEGVRPREPLSLKGARGNVGARRGRSIRVRAEPWQELREAAAPSRTGCRGPGSPRAGPSARRPRCPGAAGSAPAEAPRVNLGSLFSLFCRLACGDMAQRAFPNPYADYNKSLAEGYFDSAGRVSFGGVLLATFPPRRPLGLRKGARFCLMEFAFPF